MERWSTDRAPAASATGTERWEANCSTWQRSATPAEAASAPIRSRSSFENAIDSTKMSSARTLPGSMTSGSIASTSSIHCPGEKPGGTAWASSAVDTVVCGTRSASSRARRKERSSPSRESP